MLHNYYNKDNTHPNILIALTPFKNYFQKYLHQNM